MMSPVILMSSGCTQKRESPPYLVKVRLFLYSAAPERDKVSPPFGIHDHPTHVFRSYRCLPQLPQALLLVPGLPLGIRVKHMCSKVYSVLSSASLVARVPQGTCLHTLGGIGRRSTDARRQPWSPLTSDADSRGLWVPRVPQGTCFHTLGGIGRWSTDARRQPQWGRRSPHKRRAPRRNASEHSHCAARRGTTRGSRRAWPARGGGQSGKIHCRTWQS